MKGKTKEEMLKQPINVCGGWCSICELFLRGVCSCHENKTEHVVRCKIKRCAESRKTKCSECKDFPCQTIRILQKSYPKDGRFYVRHMWIDNVKYLKKYGEERYKKRLLADKNMRMDPFDRKKKACPCKYCKNNLKINLKKG